MFAPPERAPPLARAFLFSRCSSVVERTLGKGEAESSILSSGTIYISHGYSGRKVPGPPKGGATRRAALYWLQMPTTHPHYRFAMFATLWVASFFVF